MKKKEYWNNGIMGRAIKYWKNSDHEQIKYMENKRWTISI